jgi:hypothetical protein
MCDLKENCLYFVRDEFFDLVQDAFLKKNKETTARPHYFPYLDEHTGLCWLIPCSSQIDKYRDIIQKKQEKHKPHNHIQIVKVMGKEQAFLYQDMFPILPKYIDRPYQNKYGVFEIKDKNLAKQIKDNSQKIIKLIRHGIKFTPTQPDALRIEQIMLDEMNNNVDV